MSNWTINNTPLSALGLSVASLEFHALSASRLTLDVEVESYAEASGFSVGDALVLRRDAAVVFVGKVRRVPRVGSGTQESLTYEVTDAWDDLDRLPFQTSVNRISGYDEEGVPITGNYYIGKVRFEDDVNLGARVSAVVSFAAAACGLAVGSISAPVTWVREEFKDRTCGEVLRELMRLLVDYHLYIDHSSGSQVMHLRARASLAAVSYNVAAGEQIVDHQIAAAEFEKASVVAVRFEKPVTVDGVTRIEIYEDKYPAEESTNQLGAVIETAQLQGANVQHEYATITCAAIAQEGDSETVQKEWWIERVMELSKLVDTSIAAGESETWLAGIMDIPNWSTSDTIEEGIMNHTLKVIDDGNDRPEPINPNATPVVQTTDVADYPNEIIEGQLPEWAGKRYRKLRATVSLAITEDDFEGISNETLRKEVSKVFASVETYGETTYRIASFQGEVMATNATTGTYPRVVSWDAGEEAPTGIAEAVYTQLSATRYSGSVTLMGADPDTSISLANKLSFTGGKTDWSSMAESVQSVSHDLSTGTTTVSYGPSEELGPNDLIERLRANRRNAYYSSPTPDDGDEIEDGVGGYVAGPFSNFSRVSGGEGVSDLPFTVYKDGDDWKAKAGALFASSAFYTITGESDNLSASRADGDHSEVEVLGMVEDDQTIGTLQAAKYGVWMCTDHLGAVQWVVFGWEGDQTKKSHNPIQAEVSIGMYFFPIAEFEADGGSGFKLKKQIRKSDIYWSATSVDAAGTTAAWTPPTVPAEPT